MAKLGLASLGLAAALVCTGLLASTQAAAAGGAADEFAQGRMLFVDWSCSSCHALKDAGGGGHIGPSFDGNAMTKQYAINRITNGQGAMPGFGGQLTDDEIDILADYITRVSAK